MGDAVAVLLALVLVAGAVAAPIVAFRWQLRRRNRLHPAIPSAAPLRWLVAPTGYARLHRRLRSTVRVAALHCHRNDPALADVVEHAVEIDRRVVLASHRPLNERWAALRALDAEVDELEQLALAVRPHDPERIGSARERLVALAEARAEIEQVSRSAGG
jgi:hypothetical protein